MALADDELDRAKQAPSASRKSAGNRVSLRDLVIRPVLGVFNAVRRMFAILVFASLTRRIVFLNLAALAALVIGILYLNQWRAGLIDARVQSLRIQGEIISAAIAASATVDSDVITVNPDRLLKLQSGESLSPLSFFDPTLEFPINPERVGPLLGNLVTPTKTRARIYDRDGFLILDSRSIYTEGQVFRQALADDNRDGSSLMEWWNSVMSWVPGSQFATYQEYDASEGKRYPEVASALSGAPADIVRVDENGRLLVSVAVPVQRLRAIVGVLLLSTQPGDIDKIIATERMNVLRLALIAALISTLLSFLLARTIAGPMQRLSEAAERVQTSMNDRAEIPDFTDRPDEIGHLSAALRAMTDALYNRIEAIERFAADVAHELKNPLTSLRSAVETLPLAKKPGDRERLVKIIHHDVRRLDRLISDISNASRLDAELAREKAENVDIEGLVQAMVVIQNDIAIGQDVEVIAITDGKPAFVAGHESRFAQVLSNLIDNAVSFSPDGGKVKVQVTSTDRKMHISVTDEGPGIPGESTRIFERFYTDRPDAEQFGEHSGLGLSISQQIIEAYKGTITARNRRDGSGAIFEVILPKAKK